VTEKKSPEIANNRSAQGSSGNAVCPGPPPGTGQLRGRLQHPQRRTAQGAPRVPAAPVPTSRLMATPRPRRAAMGAARVPASPVPTYPLVSSTRLPAQGSFRDATCPRDSGPDENSRAEQLGKQSS
jgi:hypothetical protein